jgi:predicted kinase
VPPPRRAAERRLRPSPLPLSLTPPVLVVFVGAAGSGKTTLAGRLFAPGDVLSSDEFRRVVSGDAANQAVTRTAFSILHREVTRRLAAGRLVVVDATNVERHARLALIRRAMAAGAPAHAVVLALPDEVVQARNAARAERVVDSAIVQRHLAVLAATLEAGGLDAEGFTTVHVLRSDRDVEALLLGG